MSYEKQTWVTGETITAEKLNHMEDGIMESGGVVEVIWLFSRLLEQEIQSLPH